jgi:hypothetical protein
MRLAHLILAHNTPLSLERLVNRLIYDNTDIYIHLDKKQPISAYRHISALPGVVFITNRVDVTWGNYSMIAATIKSMGEILKSANSYSHINLLSGADYPLKSPDKIQSFLFENTGKTFIRWKHIYNEWGETKSRFDKYSFGDYKFPFRYKLQKIFNRRLAPRKLPNGLEPFGFSQWFTITPECAAYVIQYLEKNDKVRRFFRMTWAADELVFQTILLNSPLKDKLINDHLRYIKFKRKARSPEILTIADKHALISSDKFYARKFDAGIDKNILDFLDEVIELEPKV